MTALPGPTTVDEAFFAPLAGLAAAARLWPCREFSDDDWLRFNIHRVLGAVPSGRGFLQEHAPRSECGPTRSNYFASLDSERRAALARDVNLALVASSPVPDRLAGIPELARHRVFAVDGHWHANAARDPRDGGAKAPAGHFSGLDLGSHFLRHLAVAESPHEHDMSVLKRLKPAGLRQGVPKGPRVLVVYDRGGIGFACRKRCRQECAVYFLGRVKAGMVFEHLMDRPAPPGRPGGPGRGARPAGAHAGRGADGGRGLPRAGEREVL